MSKLNALLYIKKNGLIDNTKDDKYLGCHGGDYIFGLKSGKIVAIDLVLNSHRISNFRNGNNS